MAKSGKIRLADIAEKLNVSTVTVSKAIADKDGVSEDLREKIKQLASEMGYRFKSSKTAAKSGKTGNIGVLIPYRYFGKKSSFYWVLYNHVARELMLRDNYCIMELLSSEDENEKRLPRMIQENKVDGVIILGQLKSDYIDFFTQTYPACIFLDFYCGHNNFDAVVSDNYYSMYLLTDYLIGLGHRDIKFIGTYRATSSIQDRYLGFVKAMLEHNLHVNHEEIIDDRDDDGLYVELKFPQKMPDAFVCNCDEVAFLVIKKLQSLGFKVPEDVSVVGFDNYLLTGISEPAITTVEVDSESMARVSVDMILRKIAGKRYNAGRNVIAGKIVLKESVKERILNTLHEMNNQESLVSAVSVSQLAAGRKNAARKR